MLQTTDLLPVGSHVVVQMDDGPDRGLVIRTEQNFMVLEFDRVGRIVAGHDIASEFDEEFDPGTHVLIPVDPTDFGVLETVNADYNGRILKILD